MIAVGSCRWSEPHISKPRLQVCRRSCAQRDGRVRPLDVAASGTLFGDSVGVLCLEVDDDGNSGRPILCQLVATSVTNDGRAKAGYSAPSALAQARAITQSTRRARLTGRDVDAVELHATATKLGDAIEVSGVTRALGVREAATDAPLRLTCIKGNIGHANCAAIVNWPTKSLPDAWSRYCYAYSPF